MQRCRRESERAALANALSGRDSTGSGYYSFDGMDALSSLPFRQGHRLGSEVLPNVYHTNVRVASVTVPVQLKLYLESDEYMAGQIEFGAAPSGFAV